MNILVIGSGGREHAITWAFANSPKVDKLYIAAGNGGTDAIATSVAIDYKNDAEVIFFCKENNIDLVVIGPEAPLVDGLTDTLEAADIKVFGSSKLASQLEASKEFTKKICDKYDIRTAKYKSFTEPTPAKEFARELGIPVVIKADGLAAGKGVIIAENIEDADKAIEEMLAGQFGDASKVILVEEFLSGEEISVFAICDGKEAVLFGSAQDHKRVGEGDTGLNTGGMGTYSPAPVMNPKLEQQIMDEFIKPTMDGMAAEGHPFKGVLFAGLMIDNGKPILLEYNVRFGDPETQSLMRLLESDLAEIMYAAACGDLSNTEVKLSSKTAITVVMAANGYPSDYQKGTEIKNLDKAGEVADVVIFHAGTKLQDGKLLVNGGRVLNITATGSDIVEARKKAYDAIDLIDWQDGFYRRDIAWRAVPNWKGADSKKSA